MGLFTRDIYQVKLMHDFLHHRFLICTQLKKPVFNFVFRAELSGEASSGDLEQWFFFIPKQESEIRGGRPRRLTALGYWKATGSPGPVYSNNSQVIGVKRTMVFYTGRAPNGTKTKWKMNEYKLFDGEIASLDLPFQVGLFSISLT